MQRGQEYCLTKSREKIAGSTLAAELMATTAILCKGIGPEDMQVDTFAKVVGVPTFVIQPSLRISVETLGSEEKRMWDRMSKRSISAWVSFQNSICQI
jgi:hypothetical protein